MPKYLLIEEDIHSEELQDIIAKPPSWLLKRGISFILITILMILGISVFIKYPEIVNAPLKFNSDNAPKMLLSKVDGNLVKLLVKEGVWVKKNQDIAYIESVADHDQVIKILDYLKNIRSNQINKIELDDNFSPYNLELGELQNSFQNFYLSYISYRAISEGGIFGKRKKIVNNELNYVNEQNQRINQTYELQKKELELAEAEYQKYKSLADKKIISSLELQQKEAALLSKRQSIPQIENNIISNKSNLLSKNKELSEIENQIFEEEKKFSHSLNSFISEAENWKKQFIISSPVEGILVYGNFLQENQFIKSGDPLFYVHTEKNDYFGEMFIPQSTSSKVKKNQKVILKVRSFPHQEYGYLNGKIDYISNIPLRDSVFLIKVGLIRNEKDSIIKLKPGILADAEIITENRSILFRIWQNIVKSINF
ncbi:HlyD family secretion protein [Sphingobacterium sp. HJSM2_6]|uniref:HlyD family secretion protein n=1 Tax=Sphingobacterium sp. HJSM2_6 TaxID=3366264 RepID=UPI003BE62AFB